MGSIVIAAITTLWAWLPGQTVSWQAQGSTYHIVSLVAPVDLVGGHPTVPNFSQASWTFDVPRHDPTLGRLKEVRTQVWKRTQWRWRFENLDPTASSDMISFQKNLDVVFLEAQIHHWPMYSSPWSIGMATGFHHAIGAFDGVLDFAGTGGATSPWYFQGWEHGHRVDTTPLLLDDFTGRGPMPFELSVSSGYQSVTQLADYRDKLQATAYVRILVEYRW